MKKQSILCLLTASMILLSGCGNLSENPPEHMRTSDTGTDSPATVEETLNSNLLVETKTAFDAVPDHSTAAKAKSSKSNAKDGKNTSFQQSNQPATDADTSNVVSAPTDLKTSEISKEASESSPVIDQPKETSEPVQVSEQTQGTEQTPAAPEQIQGTEQTPAAEQPNNTPETAEAIPPSGEKEETFYGILIDEDCSDFEDPPLHDLPCMLMYSCRDSGYGLDILQKDGSYQFYMFDDNGQKLAWEYLNQTTRMYGLYITVTGTYEEGVIAVNTLAES